MKTLAALLTLAALVEAKPRYEFDLNTTISAALKIDAAGRLTCRILFTKGEPSLTVACGTKKQTLKIPILEGDTPQFTGQILADDYDFDGFLDLMIPTATGYGGVNWFYDLYRYNPAKQAFVEEESDADFCNPEAIPAEKTLTVPCKDGPAWYNEAYKFAAGKLYQYRSSELVHLNGFDGDEAILYAETLYNPDKSVLRASVRDAVNDNAAVHRQIPYDKVFLHKEPATIGRTESYLIKGDKVEILELRLDSETQWARIAYQSPRAGRLLRWIPLL